MLVSTRVEETGLRVPGVLLASLDAGATPLLRVRFANGHVLRATVEPDDDGGGRVLLEAGTLRAAGLVLGDPIEVDVTLADAADG